MTRSFRTSAAQRGARRMPLAAVGLVATTALLAGCGGGDSEAAPSSTSSSSSESSESGMESMGMTDGMFAAMMIPHHEMGIAMAQMGVEKGTTPGVRELAQQMVDDQQAQLPTLQSVADSAGQEPMPPEAPIEAANQDQMAELEALTGVNFDRTWLEAFRGHHMAAIMMSDVALSGTSGGEAEAVEQEIHDGQLEQVDTMNSLLEQIG